MGEEEYTDEVEERLVNEEYKIWRPAEAMRG